MQQFVVSAWRRHRVVTLLLALLLTSACGQFGPAVSVPAQPQAPSVNVASIGIAAAAPPLSQQTGSQLNGRILFVREGNLWLWQAGTSRQFSQGGTWNQPAFSSDGKDIAYVYWADNFSDIFVMSADGTNSRRLTRGQSASLPDNSWAMRPAWSPDGARLAFISDANSNHNQVWVMSSDGGSRRQLTSEALGLLWADSLAWDPSGERIAVTAAPDMRVPSNVYLIDVAKGTFEKLSTQLNGAYDPSFSPDGSAIAYVGRPNSRGVLVVQTLDGKQTASLDKLPFLRSPVWAPDGKTIAFLAGQGGTFEIWTMSVQYTAAGFELGEPHQLTRDAAVDPISGLSWAP